MDITAKRLLELRHSVSLSQAKMAEVLGISQSSLNRYEHDQAIISDKVLCIYADYFDVSLDYICGRTENSDYEIDPLTSPIVLEMFTRYADGQTVAEISEAMNSRGVFTNTKYKYTNKSSLHNLLKNRRYIGEYRYGDTVVPDGMPAIVPPEIFDAVQKRMEKNKHKPAAMKANEEYILTTKIFCGKCGSMMVGVGGTSKTGKVHHYYKCGNVIYKKSCDKKTVQKAWIERHIVALTREFVLRDVTIDRLADAIVELQKRENTTIPFLQKQLGDIEKRIGNLINSIEEGLANASIKQRLDDLESKKADLEIALAKEKIEKTPLTKEQIVFWISRFKDGDIDDPAYRKAIVDIFVNSIFLYDDLLVITFNWKDGTKTLTLAELENAASGGDEAGETGKALQTAEKSCSYLDGNRPPKSSALFVVIECWYVIPDEGCVVAQPSSSLCAVSAALISSVMSRKKLKITVTLSGKTSIF